MVTAYVAEPIDLRDSWGVPDPSWIAFNDHLRMLRENGYILYRPSSAFDFISTGPQAVRPNADVYNINQAVLLKVNRVVAWLDGRSVGVPAEIQWAVDHGVRVDIFAPAELVAKSWQLAGWAQYDNRININPKGC